MTRLIYFISHPEVVVSREVPVTQWPLSARGRSRMLESLKQPWVDSIGAVYCSTEQKAIDGATLLATHLGLGLTQLAALGENDRSSTGFLPPDEFETVADEFFARPAHSVRGWERAIDAQARITHAVEHLAAHDHTTGAIAIVSHGAVGTLLYCALRGLVVSRQFDQPGRGGGNYFVFSLMPPKVSSWWTPIDGQSGEPAKGP